MCPGLKWIIIMYLHMDIWFWKAKKLSIAGLLECKAQKLFNLTWKRKHQEMNLGCYSYVNRRQIFLSNFKQFPKIMNEV